MTEIRDDHHKPTDTKRIIEQIENCRTGLLREVLYLGKRMDSNALQEDEIYKEIDKGLKDIKAMTFIQAGTCLIMALVTAGIIYQLYKISQKLTALGL